MIGHVRFGSLTDTTAQIGDVGFTPRADMLSVGIDVRKVPLPDISALANFAVYAGACPICWSGFSLV